MIDIFVFCIIIFKYQFEKVMIAFSGIFQAFFYCQVGPLADYGGLRKLFFILSTLLGCFFSIMFSSFKNPNTYIICGWWMVFSTIFFGLQGIFYNGWLPLLVESHPKIIHYLKINLDSTKLDKEIEELNSNMSQHGFAFGFIGTTIAMIITIVILVILPNQLYIDNNNYIGKSNGKSLNKFDERYGKNINYINIWYYDNNNISQIYGIKIYYNNNIEGKLHGSNMSLYNKSL